MLNKHTRKIEVTFNLTFDDYHIKRVEQTFAQQPILLETNDKSIIVNSFDIDYELSFGVPNRAIDVEVHAEDTQIPEASNHSDDSTMTREEYDSQSTST